MDFETIRAMALENGFSYAAPMDCALLELRQEVREMCAANTCGMYGKIWPARRPAARWSSAESR